MKSSWIIFILLDSMVIEGYCVSFEKWVFYLLGFYLFLFVMICFEVNKNDDDIYIKIVVLK